MTLIETYKQFPTHNDCIRHLEKIRWNNHPQCPYCQSNNYSSLKSERRYHCNTCNTSYSVTVGTIFHKTRIDLQKWFLSISRLLKSGKKPSARGLAGEIGVNKNTAWYMAIRVRKALYDDRTLIRDLVATDETHLKGGRRRVSPGDKPRSRRKTGKTLSPAR